MLNHQLVDSGVRAQPIVQHGRAVRVGDHIIISATTAMTPSGLIVGANDPRMQTRFILDQTEQEVRKLGGELRDVTLLRVTVSRFDHWEPVARVIGERFPSIRPAHCLNVSRLNRPQLFVQIAADATVGSGGISQRFIL